MYGDGTNTVGGGVLDLRNVKADTGHDIFELTHFAGYGITALIAPDVPSISDAGLFRMANRRRLSSAIFPPLMRPAESEIEKRRDRLLRLGISGAGRRQNAGRL